MSNGTAALKRAVRPVPVVRGAAFWRVAAARQFANFLALGAGITELGLASNALAEATVEHAWPVAGAAVAAILVGAVGLAFLAYSMSGFRRGTPVVLRLATPALAVVIVLNLLSYLGQLWLGKHSDGGALATLVLQLPLWGLLMWLKRQNNPVAHELPAGRAVLLMFICSVVVGIVATAGLASGTAGQFAMPMENMKMDMPMFTDPGGHHH